MKNSDELIAAALFAAANLSGSRGSLEDFTALKPPKRGGSRESIPTAANLLRRAYIDQVAATEESLRGAWRYGCWLFQNCCYICGKPFLVGEPPQADHVIPPGAGGSTNAGNMLPAHRICNDLKGDQLPEEYFADQPLVLEQLSHFQKQFNFAPDSSLYPLASEKVSGYIELMKKDILHTRNLREGALEDSGEDLVEYQQVAVSPLVSNLMKAVNYYMKINNFVPTAQRKMSGCTRRIMQHWHNLNPNLDLFTQDEVTVKAFMLSYFLTITDHRDTFNRGHRAFRILGEVFESKALLNIYTEGSQLTLAELRESTNTATPSG